MDYRDFWEEGWPFFALHGVDDNGNCECGTENCPALFKHPRASNWQHTPIWSEEQIETMELMGQLDTGYGVLVSTGLLVVDVDARNGGVKSFEKLAEAVPEIAGAGLVVNTGSGGGSKHLYFRAPTDVPMVQHLDAYPGIDFKSTGYVVGPGSRHKSGSRYETAIGSASDIGDAPTALVELLRKPERYRSKDNSGAVVDYSLKELRDMVMAIPNTESVGHEKYIRIGMGLHECTGGIPEAFDIWHEWASQSPRFKKSGKTRIENRWHSFGKSTDPVSIGTVKHYAEEAGWVEPVTFSDTQEWDLPEDAGPTLSTEGIDLLRPPGFVGEITQWINQNNRYPRERLSVAAAIATVSSIAGMRYVDPLDGITPNLFFFGVSGSGTGKESVLKNHQALLKAAGVSAAVHGGIKSEQEIFRNLIRHQAALYVLDELGEQLSKIQKARQSKGGASYLEGIIGVLMSVYSKADGFALVTGDLKEEIRRSIQAEISAVKKQEGEDEEERVPKLMNQLKSVDNGIENPYLCMFGLTTPNRFDSLLDFEMTTNGFFGRAILAVELNDNPRPKSRREYKKTAVPDTMGARLQALYAPGYSDVPDRVERMGEVTAVETTEDAEQMLDDVMNYFLDMAEDHGATGMTPIPRRGYEQVAKVSMVLAIPSGLRTIEHVRWAFALIKNDVETKIKIVMSNDGGGKADALMNRIMSLVTAEHGETVGRIANKCRKWAKEDVNTALDKLEKMGAVKFEEVSAGRSGGKKTKKYYSTR